METEGREIRLLNNEIGPQAQQLPPNVVFTPDVTAAAEEAATRGEMKRRVLFLSVILAVYVVVNALVQYVFDAAAIETALEQIRTVTDVKGAPSLAKLLLHAIGPLVFTIFLGLLVPLCGYLGAKQNSQGLMGCFCGCNFLHCSCSLCALIGSVIVLFMLSAAEPGIEQYLKKCDPQQCANWPEHWSEKQRRKHTVDCLAAGMWPDEYERSYSGPAYPKICPKFMLKCKSWKEAFGGNLKRAMKPWLRGGVPAGQGPNRGGGQVEPVEPIFLPRAEFEGDADEAVPMAPVHAEDSIQAVPAMAARSVPAVTATSPLQMPSKGPFWRRLEGLTHPREWYMHGWHDADTDMDVDMPDIDTPGFVMPDDPLNNCEPDEKGMKIIHEASIVVPHLVPKLVMLMAVKCLLLIPVILFGCLGFWWGKELWSKMGQGYGHLYDGPQGGAATMAAVMPPRVVTAEMPQVVHPQHVQAVHGTVGTVAAPAAVVEQE